MLLDVSFHCLKPKH